ncbi:MarR family winged helix-turn-helix transcriptional regulator [Pigmentiphaga sp. D-2]|uniref:MarR family winged helix-turn-helix transcriptional regulator n=1 Tax=Pigmentiphaga sp. D-2 TaxID=1002116 RepID=UPI0010435BB6|nr:MarR family winged helix-turn-helix transcriptional regulator [Pigmentiphaga sp. D-2]
MNQSSPSSRSPLATPAQAEGYLPHALSRLMNGLNARLMKALRPTDLTIQQFRVMQFLRWMDVASISEICKGTVIEQSVVSRIVDQLQQRGFASRSRSAASGRVVEVKLTAVGVAVYDALDPQARKIVEATTSVLDPAEQRQLHGLLGRLFEQVQKLEQDDGEQA